MIAHDATDELGYRTLIIANERHVFWQVGGPDLLANGVVDTIEEARDKAARAVKYHSIGRAAMKP